MNFFLIVLRISFSFNLDISYKYDRFIKVLLEKNLKFCQNKKKSDIAFILSFMLLLAEVILISEKQGCKKIR